MQSSVRIPIIALVKALTDSGAPESEIRMATRRARAAMIAGKTPAPGKKAKPDPVVDGEEEPKDDGEKEFGPPPKKKKKKKSAAAVRSALAQSRYAIDGMHAAVARLEADAAQRADVKARTFKTPGGPVVLSPKEIEKCAKLGLDPKKYAAARLAMLGSAK